MRKANNIPRRWWSRVIPLICLFTLFLSSLLPACSGMRSSVTDSDYRKALASTDQAVLAKIALGSKNWKAREEAAERLTDQEILYEVFLNSRTLKINEIALGRITKQSILSSIALENQWWYFRQLAVINLTDQVVLARIASQDPEKKVRLEAIENIHDQNTLLRIINDTPYEDHDILLAAIKNTTDQAVLADIVLGKGRWSEEIPGDFSKAALNARAQTGTNNITDQKVLGQILRDEGRWSKFYNISTLTAVVMKTTDPEVLAEVAQGRGRSGKLVRIEAVMRLSDQAVLSSLALDEEDLYVRRAATTRLTENVSLQSVIQKYPGSQADLAKIVMFLDDPVILSHAPKLEAEFRIRATSRAYSYYGLVQDHSVKGEKISLTVGLSKEVIGSWEWKTVFPEAVRDRSVSFIRASIDFDDLISTISSALGLTENERSLLSRESPVDEVRDFFSKPGAQ